MNKILVAVDGTKGSKAVLSVFNNLVRPPEEVILLHVEEIGGGSMMYDMLGDAEMSTLKEMVKDGAHKESLDERAKRILSFYRRELGNGGLVSIRTEVRLGKPSEEITKLAEEEGVDMIVMGCGDKGAINKLVSGCVSSDVRRSASVPVLVAKQEEDAEACEKSKAFSPAETLGNS